MNTIAPSTTSPSMSYLSSLRLHFAGRFQTTVSTVNNDPTHFDNASFKPEYQQRSGPEGANGWWNPDGDGTWKLLGCRITSAFYEDGSPVAEADPVLTLQVADADNQVPAKLVDLDPEQQLVSTIFGLVIRIADDSGRTLMQGEFDPAPFSNIWARLQGRGPGGDAKAAAQFQSVVRNLEWGDVSGSRFLQQLKKTAKDGLLSVKFNVDRYSMDFKGDQFCRGRLVGTLGPATADEPAHFVLGRQFLATFNPSDGFPEPTNRIMNCVGVVDETAGKVRLDLGNALPSPYAGEELSDIGALSLAWSPAPGKWTSLGGIEYLEKGWYERTAGVVELPEERRLTAEELEALKSHPLGLLTQNGNLAPVPAITEPPNGLHVGVDMFVFRLSPGETQTARLYATQYGAPYPHASIISFRDPNWLQGGTGMPPVATPEGGIEFQARVTADERGCALLPITGSNPGNPRRYIDGQVYGVRCALEDTLGYGMNYPFAPTDFISLLVFDTFTADEPLAWYGTPKGSIQTIFQQYANLYPVMSRFLDMGSYESVCQYAEMLKFAFSLDERNPNSMPVTRDLSPAKRRAILQWLSTLGPDRKPLLGQQQPPRLEALAAKPPVTAKVPAAQAQQGGKAAAIARSLQALRH